MRGPLYRFGLLGLERLATGETFKFPSLPWPRAWVFPPPTACVILAHSQLQSPASWLPLGW